MTKYFKLKHLFLNNFLIEYRILQIIIESSGLGLSKDIGLWPKEMNNNVGYWIQNYSSEVQFCNEDLLKLKSEEQKDGQKTRKCTQNMFFRAVKTGENVKRSWLCFSPKTGRLYCFFCKLFDTSQESQFTENGFYDWKHATNRLISHETSKAHLIALVRFNNMKKKMNVSIWN